MKAINSVSGIGRSVTLPEASERTRASGQSKRSAEVLSAAKLTISKRTAKRSRPGIKSSDGSKTAMITIYRTLVSNKNDLSSSTLLSDYGYTGPICNNKPTFTKFTDVECRIQIGNNKVIKSLY